VNIIEKPTGLPQQRFAVALTVGDHSLRSLRRTARSQLRAWAVPDLTDTFELVLTELVTNVYRHVPDRWCMVTLQRTDQGVRVEAYDRSPAVPVERSASEWDEHGRGLALVAQLADEWDVVVDGEGKTVRCEVLR
jgi:anti-sigma regulatory factor (Ser/Thr protein kinase)